MVLQGDHEEIQGDRKTVTASGIPHRATTANLNAGPPTEHTHTQKAPTTDPIQLLMRSNKYYSQ
jgi:hypothetical protein